MALTEDDRHASMRLNWKTILLLSGSLFGSFFITLWLTAPPDLPPVVRPEALNTIAASSNGDVLEELSAAGFHLDSGITGNVDLFERQPDKSVRIAGWAVDPWFGDGNPLTVLVYIDGQPRLRVNTAGSRDDVRRTLNLEEKVAKNVAFSGTLNCETSARAMVLAVSATDGRYAQLNAPRCP
jgi:hypothetical protein